MATVAQWDLDYWLLNRGWLLNFTQSLFFCRYREGSACVHERLQSCVVICVSCTFHSTDGEKRETVHRVGVCIMEGQLFLLKYDFQHFCRRPKSCLMGGQTYLSLIIWHQLVYDLWNENSDLNKLPQYYAVNTISYINIATLLLPELQKTNGSIVAVSSFAGVVSTPRAAPYCGNKHALHGFFDTLRQDLAIQGQRDITITLYVLGYIDTKNTRTGTKGTPLYHSVKPEPVNECALAMIKGIALRKRQMYFPWYLSIVETVHFFFPDFVESVIQVATNEKPVHDLWNW